MDLTIDARGLAVITADLNATQKQVQAAMRSTLPKVATWLKARSVKGLSHELDVQQKIMRRRLKSFRLRSTDDGGAVQVWYGLDPIAMIYLVGKTATRVPARAAPGSFIAGKGDRRQVFKRIGSKRLPIQKQVLEIQDQAQTWIEDKLVGGDEFQARFYEIFEHELQWRTRTRK